MATAHTPDAGRGTRLFDCIESVDKILIELFSLCSSSQNLLGFLRPTVKVVEISGHGGVWLLIVPFMFFVVHTSEFKEKLLNLQFALILDIIINATFKAIFRRPRPPQNFDDQGNILIDCYSMPSGHAARALMIYVYSLLNLDLGQFWMDVLKLWVLLIIASRLLLARHYPSDLVVGGIIGALEGLMVSPSMFWVSMDWAKDFIASMVKL